MSRCEAQSEELCWVFKEAFFNRCSMRYWNRASGVLSALACGHCWRPHLLSLAAGYLDAVFMDSQQRKHESGTGGGSSLASLELL